MIIYLMQNIVCMLHQHILWITRYQMSTNVPRNTHADYRGPNDRAMATHIRIISCDPNFLKKLKVWRKVWK